MIQTLFKNITKGREVRKNLIELRKEIKDPLANRILFYELEGDYTVLYRLLEDEDPKVRKNVALIMGELGVEAFLEKLYTAYEKEEKLFVKADYLTAISYMNYDVLAEALKARLHTLTTLPIEENSAKHINEEIRLLSSMCIKLEKPKMHRFTGHTEQSDIILLTNRNHQEATLNEIESSQAKIFNAGVLVRTSDLNQILKIRTYSEILFKLPKAGKISMHPQEAAREIFESGVLEFMNARHEGWAPYYFRLELKTRMPLDKKSIFAKKMASELEKVSNRQLINSTSNYEFEIRLIENKEGYFNLLLKLYTLKDTRFTYRKYAVAASIAPDDAALMVTLAKPYMMPDAQVLDPFCGVGTMLIEREKQKESAVMYGIDLFGEAIDGAIANSEIAEVDSYFINRDFFGFTHKYKFDEIFTNMPARGGRKTEADMEKLYADFFKKALEVLNEEAVVILYTRDQQEVFKGIETHEQYTLEATFEISKKEGAYLYILKVRQ